MVSKKSNKNSSVRKMISFVLIVSVSVQLIIITYNHVTGFSIITGVDHLIVRFLFGTLLTMVGGFIVTIPDLWVINYLNTRLPWSGNILLRIVIQFLSAVLIAVAATTFVTLLSHSISSYKEGLFAALRVNWLITSVINIIVMSILEALVYFNESKKAKLQTQQLEREMFNIRYEVLKNQINPHFMFNSLNVLSGLIEKDTKKAQNFIDEFAHIYRYVLESIDRLVVPLKDELDFINSYLYLQKIRYEDAICLKVNVPAELFIMVLPPLSLQLVLENAVKHNILSKEQPLCINIYNEGSKLVIENNIQQKVSMGVSTGVGQMNLRKRYKMISGELPEFYLSDGNYVVKLPLIRTEDDKSTDY